MRQPIRLGLVGFGKIARDQHLPAVAGSPAFSLTAVASPHPVPDLEVPRFRNLAELLESGPTIDAVVLCTPPQPRRALAAEALNAGLHVFLEKPPGATVSEIAGLERLAGERGVTLFASWHSRFAAGVEPARDWLAHRTIRGVEIEWREDVRYWHPGQEWIWTPGGLGVFDPGINALSIVTRILPRRVFLTGARLDFPQNRAAPIAARLEMEDADGAPVTVDLDWLQTGPQTWDIRVRTDDGVLLLQRGGSVLVTPDGREDAEDREYAGLYARFAELIESSTSEVDVEPLRLVADAFLVGERREVARFDEA